MFFLTQTIQALRNRTTRRAIETRRELKHRRARRQLRAEVCEARVLLASDVLPFDWVDQGPAPTINGQLEPNTQPNRQVTGAIHTVVAHPTDANTVYIGGVNGGIWKTTDFTSLNPRWTPQTDFLESLSIGAMAFDPTDASFNTLVAGTAKYSSFAGLGGIRGPVYRTVDGGATWNQLPGNGLLSPGENISGIAARGNVIVVSSSGNRGGIFRSIDTGVTFNPISSAGFNSPNDDFSDLVEDPSDATDRRLYAVSPGSGGRGAIYRSDDFGASWNRITGSNAEMNQLLSQSNNVEMAVHPTTGRLYVATLVSGQPQGIFYSSNPTDASPTWIQMDVPVLPLGSSSAVAGASNTSPIEITSNGHGLSSGDFVVIDGIAGNTAANGFFRVTRVDGNTFSLNNSTGNGAYGGGGTWVQVTGPNPTSKDIDETGAQGRIHFSIVVDPTNEDIVYIGGDRQEQPNPIGDNTFGGAIFRGNASITRNPNVAPSPQWDHATHDFVPSIDPDGGTANGTAPHADSREMVFDAAGNLVEVDDGGIYIRTSPRDRNGDWFSKAGTLGVIEFHDIAYDSTSGILMGGTQDNGTHFQQTPGGKVWDFLSGGDGGDVSVDTITLAASNRSIRYSSFQNLGVFRKTTWDANNNRVGTEFPSLTVTSGPAFSPQFKTPVQLNAVDPTRILFIGSNGIYESFNQGDTIAQVQSASTGFLQDAVDYGGYQNGVPNEDVFYVGLRDDVHIRTSASGPVTTIDPDTSSGADIRDVIMNPDDWTNAFLIDDDSVLQTVDAGLNWSDITGNLMSIAGEALQTITFVPGPIGALVVGANQGVFVSQLHKLGTWIEVGANLPNALVFDLIYNATSDLLVAGTLGRGAWTLPEASVRLAGPELLAVDQNLRTVEDVSGGLVIPATTLLNGTLVNGSPLGTDPQSRFFVQSVVTSGGTLDAGNRADITTTYGTLSATFDANDNITELVYRPAQDFNSENLPAAVGDFLDDSFDFTVVDRSATPTDPGSSTAAASIRVTPQNDVPVVTPDDVSVTDPNGDYVTYYTNRGAAAPIPTEDQLLSIPFEFLLQNDSQARASAADENAQFNRNDGPLRLVSASPVDASLVDVFAIDFAASRILIRPVGDVFGEIQFTYTVADAGINQAAELDALGNPSPKLPGSLQATSIVSVYFEPVNDPPQAINHLFRTTEAVESIDPPAFIAVTAADLLQGATASDATLGAPFNEGTQILSVNSISSNGTTLTDSGTLVTASGGTIEVTFIGGAFAQAVYTPPVDFNGNDTFTYTVVDDGAQEFPIGTALAPSAPATSAAAIVTLTVDPANDFPVFEIPAEIDILERDDDQATVITSFFTNVGGGPIATATDEQLPAQQVSFTITPVSVPAGLMTQVPDVSLGTSIAFFPAPDQFGSAVYEVTATDDGSPVRSISKRFTVHVRPVNDPPRFDPSVAGSSDSAGPDEAYSVANNDFNNDGLIDDATITYTLREDNTQVGGDPAPYFIPLTASVTGGYDQIGLLDVFAVGPDNEAQGLPGGSQVIDFVQAGNDPFGGVDRTTDRGGSLAPVFDPNTLQLIGLHYTPPADFNMAFAGLDSFSYTVRDRSTTGGETFNLFGGALIPDRLTATNRVELRLNPVNDRPEFSLGTNEIAIQEDSSPISYASFAFNIAPGPANSAFDEVDPLNGQSVEFVVRPLDFDLSEAGDYFATYPTINEQNGQLDFKPAANVFGEYRFEITLVDDGPIDASRGELNTSLPSMLTITIQPTNDPPQVDPNAAPLSFTILEDGTFDILVTGDNTSPGLLDPFLPGPSVGPTDESADILPSLGGNQTVSLSSPFPRTSAGGGSVTFVNTGGTPRFVYRPRANFVGTDSFIYSVIDNGVSVGIDGRGFSDPRIASNTVTIRVLPVNDQPIFSGGGNVQSQEDDGFVTVPFWATNVQAGPTTAADELRGFQGAPPQSLQFKFTPLTSNPELFTTPPAAIIDPQTGTASLTFQAAPNASGSAAFSVVLEDNGPRDASIGDQFASSPPRTFVINVAAVNDPPTFDLVDQTITRLEDSGPYTVQQAVNISPGPPDEASQSVSFEIEPLPPQFASLFVGAPTISSDGTLRFTPAANQNTDNLNGPVTISVVGRDSNGARTTPKTFQIAITEVNDPPRAVSDRLVTDENTVLRFNESALMANDIDPDLQSNADEVVHVVMPAETFSVSGARILFDSDTGMISYDPTESLTLQGLGPNELLVDSFAYSLIDAAGATSNLVTVAIEVNGINDAPSAEDDFVLVAFDRETVIPILDNDIDVDGTIVPSTINIKLPPALGSVNIDQQGRLIYTPFTSFSDQDIFTYTVKDNLGAESRPAFVTVTNNRAPVARDDSEITFRNQSVVVNVAENDFDTDGTLNLASIEILTAPFSGAAIPQDDGTVQYVPGTNFIGRDVFTYRIIDDRGRLSNVATVDVSVRGTTSPLQNPDLSNDVNDDGFVTGIDALLIVNHLSRNNVPSIPILPTDRGPNYFDTNGNQVISAADALRVINELSRSSIEPLESEQLPATGAESEFLPDDLSSSAKIVSVSGADINFDAAVNAIAAGHAGREDDDSVAAIDLVISHLVE